MRRSPISGGRIVLALACACALLLGCTTSGTVAERVAAPAGAIAEDRYVPIGGIEQWITIYGDDRSNPIILVVHGGPGNPMSPIADSLFHSWQRDFTIVQWDQRGAGRTYARHGPSAALTMSVERMALDGVEVAEFLTEYLGQDKIIIFATSWGSVLGVHMAHARPDLFHAYLGHSQFVEWDANLSATYEHLLALARAAGDQASIDTLVEIGAPPWSRAANWPRFRKVYGPYQRAATTAPAAPVRLSSAYASEEELTRNSEAEDFSFEHLWGLTLSGPLTKVDLPALGAEFDVPIYIVQGERDLWTVPELARSYFDGITAPAKQFFLVDGAGHELSMNGMALIRQVLDVRVRPQATAIAGPGFKDDASSFFASSRNCPVIVCLSQNQPPSSR